MPAVVQAGGTRNKVEGEVGGACDGTGGGGGGMGRLGRLEACGTDEAEK